MNVKEIKIRAKLSKETTFSTHPDYWDCECEHNYIHPKDEDECKVCGSLWEEQPESRTSEVYEQLFSDNRPLTEEILNELGFEGNILLIHNIVLAVYEEDEKIWVEILNTNPLKGVEETFAVWDSVGSVRMLIEVLKGDE